MRRRFCPIVKVGDFGVAVEEDERAMRNASVGEYGT